MVRRKDEGIERKRTGREGDRQNNYKKRTNKTKTRREGEREERDK